MRNVSKGKVTNGASGKPSLKTSVPQGTRPMPRVGGHTSNVTPSQGVPGGPFGNKGSAGC